jgi:hypothetical protein
LDASVRGRNGSRKNVRWSRRVSTPFGIALMSWTIVIVMTHA